MNYFTGMAISPVFEFPYSGYQSYSGLNQNNDINAILASITPGLDNQIYNHSPSINLNCFPQINTGIGDGPIVYQVPENMPIDMILQQLGVNSNTLQPSNTISNYYRTASQPMEVILSSPSSARPRRMFCRELSDSEDEGHLRRPPNRHRHHSNSRSDEQPKSPVALHNILSRVWDKAERGSRNSPSSFSAPDINSQWQSMRNSFPPSPPPNSNINNIWQSMRNASAPISPEHQRAVNNAWYRADYASELNSNRPPPPFQNREAVHDFMAARDLPYGINLPPPNREAVQDFMAARNLPYGINTVPPPSNTAVTNVWNKLDYASHQGPPMINIPWNQGPPSSQMNNMWNQGPPSPPMNSMWNQGPSSPQMNNMWNQGPPSPQMNNMWNRMQPGGPLPVNPPYPNSPMNPPQRGPVNTRAPASFASLLSQAHRQNLPYSGAS